MRFIPLKNELNNYRICSTFASSALLHLFFISNLEVFVDGGRKNISCPRAHDTLDTPLFEIFSPSSSAAIFRFFFFFFFFFFFSKVNAF